MEVGGEEQCWTVGLGMSPASSTSQNVSLGKPLIPLCLGLLICKMGLVITYFTRFGGGVNLFRHIKDLAQWLRGGSC